MTLSYPSASYSRKDKTHEVKVFNSQIQMMGTTLKVFAYFVDGMLIDSGPHRMQKEIADFCNLNRPDKIIHTHFHEDHTGNTAYLMKKFQIPAYIHPSTTATCHRKGTIPLYRWFFWGNSERFPAEPMSDFIENEHSRFEVLHTPGHTPDHVAFWDRNEGRLFTGDLFVHYKTRIARRQENIPLLMQSLRLLLKKDFNTVYCAHSGVLKQGYRLVEQKLAYLEELQDQILSMTHKGYQTKVIAQMLFPQTPTITYFSLGQFSSYNLVRSLAEDTMDE